MLLWTTSVGNEHRALLEDIKATGYDGVEVPIFGGTPDNYAKTAVMLDEVGLERTAISVIPSLEQHPLSEDPADSQRGVEYLNWLVTCATALGAQGIGGPLHQKPCHFSGAGTTDAVIHQSRESNTKDGAPRKAD